MNFFCMDEGKAANDEANDNTKWDVMRMMAEYTSLQQPLVGVLYH